MRILAANMKVVTVEMSVGNIIEEKEKSEKKVLK